MFSELLVTLPLEKNSLILEFFLHLRALGGEKSLEHVAVPGCWLTLELRSPAEGDGMPVYPGSLRLRQ